MPTTLISLNRKYSYILEGSVELPEWYDHKLHKYHYCRCCCKVEIYRKDQNPDVDEPIWEERIWFDEKISDVEHKLEDEGIVIMKSKKSKSLK